MKRVLVVHPWIRPLGGAHAVAAWALQALRDIADVTLVTWADVDLERVNRYYGTALKPRDFRLELPSPAVRRLVGALPGPAYLLRMSVLLRRCRQLDRQNAFDVLLSTFNEVDFGRRGIQYIHAPQALAGDHRGQSRYHPARLALAVYERSCARLAGSPAAGVEANLTLVNSSFIAEQVRAAYGIPAIVLHPPVPGGFPDTPWQERIDGFVWVSRFHPSKRLGEVVEIVERLRARGHDLRLTVVGTPNGRSGEAEARRLAATRAGWLSLHTGIARADLVALMARHRYAIHAMPEEHFGIVVAEYLRAGCLPFVHARGGPVEIVGGESRLTFSDVDDAVSTIEPVLRDAELQLDLRRQMERRRDLYSEERFARELRDVVERFPSAT